VTAITVFENRRSGWKQLYDGAFGSEWYAHYAVPRFLHCETPPPAARSHL